MTSAERGAKVPSAEQIELAAEWLDCNEGNGHESADCKVVADWLRAQIDAAYLRAAARQAGVPVRKLRERLAAIATKVSP